MFLAYIDDSGDQHAQVLSAVLVPSESWLYVHDRIVEFRREVSSTHGFRMRHEIKATELASPGGAGPWRRIDPPTPYRTRIGIYKAFMGMLADLAPLVQVVAVVLPDRHDPRLETSPVEEAWDILLQRLERFANYGGGECLLVPDEGNSRTVRQLARKKRRFGYAPSAFDGPAQKVPFRQLLDDPVHRVSDQSYILQAADLTAYAAFRRVVPLAGFPDGMWDLLGDAQLAAANGRARNRVGEPPGLIIWPGRRLAAVKG